jgi:hypothetical protein
MEPSAGWWTREISVLIANAPWGTKQFPGITRYAPLGEALSGLTEDSTERPRIVRII